MWANAQRDGHPAEYRWRPVLNAAKFGSRPLLKCHTVMLPEYKSARLGGCKVNFACDNFLCPAFAASHMQHVSDLHLKLELRPHNVKNR